MKKLKKAPPKATPVQQPISRPFTKTLPTELLAPIGQVMVDWAFLEFRLQELVFLALNISHPQGRLAIKSMRAFEMYQLATDLFQLEGLQLPTMDAEAVGELARRRNLLAHNVWFKDGDDYLIRDLTGTESRDGKKVKRKVQPAGVPLTAHNILNLSSAIQQTTADTEALIQDVIKRRSASANTHP